MVLVDTSSWIETLRAGGDASVRQRVSALVLDGEAAWCDMIRLELWHGVRGARETRDLTDLEDVVVPLVIDEAVWRQAVALARRARSQGLTVQAPDLVIAATAQRHEVAVDSTDSHIDRLMKLSGT
jgi:predicted nucleic acid-binding protein